MSGCTAVASAEGPARPEPATGRRGRSSRAPAGASLSALQDVILAVGSTLDLPTVLQRVVEVIAEATGHADSYIFLFDEEVEDLVLSAATESTAAPFVGVLRVPLGEGVTGFAAASRETYVVDGNLHDDPRFVLHPGLGEERYDAMLAVPIVSRSDRLIGVVSVWAAKSGRFSDEHIRLAEWISVVVAGAIENAQLHASVSRRTRVLERMAELTAMTSSGLATARLLDLVTELALEVGAADLAILTVRDPTGAHQLVMRTAFRSGPSAGDHVQLARRELLAIDAEVRKRDMTLHVAAEEVRARLDRRFSHSMTTPLRVSGEELGHLGCYRVAASPFALDDQSLLATIAGHAALTLKNALLAEELQQHNEIGRFLGDVAAGRLVGGELRERAAMLGLKARSHTVIVGTVEHEANAEQAFEGASLLLREVAQMLAGGIAGARCTASAHEVIALVPSPAGDVGTQALHAALDKVVAAVRGRSGAALTIALSAPATSLEELRTALTEAREVVTVGTEIRPSGGVVTLDDAGYHLLLGRSADLATVRDRYSVAIDTLAEYDRVRGGFLIDTLAVFLDLRSRNEAARTLFVHRNTLAQRLARIEELTGLDLSVSDDWFPLQLALRIHQVRRAKAGPPRLDGAAEGEAP